MTLFLWFLIGLAFCELLSGRKFAQAVEEPLTAPNDSAEGDEPDEGGELDEGAEPNEDGELDEGGQEPDKEQPVDKIDQNVVRQAKQMGFSDDEIQALGNTDAIKAAMLSFSRRVASMPDQQAGVRSTKPQTQQPQSDAPLFNELPKVEKRIFPAISFKADRESGGLDPETVDAMNEAYGQVDHRIELLGAEVLKIAQYLTNQQSLAEYQKIDGFIDKLDGDTWGDVFGDQNVTMDSPHGKNRAKLVSDFHRLKQSYLQNGMRPPNDETLLEHAITIGFKDGTARQIRKELTSKAQNRGKQAITRPGGRSPKQLPMGEDRAVATVSQKLREWGIEE